MDPLDARILEILRQNARTPFLQIARGLGVSEGTVRVRVKKLTEKGVIKKFTIIVARSTTKALIDVKVGVNVSTATVASRIKNVRGVISVFEISGDYDIVALLELESINELNEVIDEIRGIEEISSTRTSLILKEH
ncbi:MAG: Lrp/AsnC family transcriptional regulator [Candidatus Thermoplasmatota archaeon]|nr:Lrp/AsnC family transcriptional regulator [Candidatus Thermoplasmatota archaeon]